MSAIGSPGLGAINLAGSLAGVQKNEASSDRIKEGNSSRKFQVDQQSMSAESMGDVSDPAFSADRDPDGRQSSGPSRPGPSEEESLSSAVLRQGRHAPDPSGDRGTLLDLDA